MLEPGIADLYRIADLIHPEMAEICAPGIPSLQIPPGLQDQRGLRFDLAGRPEFSDDMRGQIGLAPHNRLAGPAQADMGLGNVVCVIIYTTNVDEAVKHLDLMGRRFGPAGCAPRMTLLGVSRLALPGRAAIHPSNVRNARRVPRGVAPGPDRTLPGHMAAGMVKKGDFNGRLRHSRRVRPEAV